MAAPKKVNKIYDSEIEPDNQLALPRRAPARTPEAREDQLIALAYDLAENQLTEGTASGQVILHLLKAGSRRERLEQLKLTGEVRLNETRIDNLESATRSDELYREAMKAFSLYRGEEGEEDD